MRRIALYVVAALLEAAWFVICLFVLAEFRRDAVVFFEVILGGAAIACVIAWQAKQYAEQPQRYGRLASRIEDWTRLQAIMREEERQRRRHGI